MKKKVETILSYIELFSEVGDLKRYSIHYDRSGRSKGTAEVVFSRRGDAVAAVKRYTNVQLDGKPMKIEIVGTNIATAAGPPPPATNGSFRNSNGFASSRLYVCIRKNYEKPGGIIALLDEAWYVTYQTELFLDKNKDYVVAEHQELLGASNSSFVAGLFPPLPEESSKSSKFSSIGSRFKSLLETLSVTIRCVKPNNLLKLSIFENSNILQQLHCGGVMEAIRISCAGYPTRKPFREFVGCFGILDPNVFAGSCDEVTASKRLLESGSQGLSDNHQFPNIGKTKVFLRAGQMAELDACRSEVLGRSASVIQRKVRSYLARKSFILLRDKLHVTSMNTREGRPLLSKSRLIIECISKVALVSCSNSNMYTRDGYT
ncbi:hypothetical protein G4B88_011136 [Cannabis sativa]|uniref:RRM domain-containing protein n=1 Tax=Cannabis sativa TaxID=3483 RepID=A0A7J6HI08_CANSA|nr:hypothetical protein G4B88_011136 [Cannabis sativa]